MNINIPARLEERTSKEGNKYFCIIVELAPDVDKMIFLEKSEIALIKLTYGKSNAVKLPSSQQ